MSFGRKARMTARDPRLELDILELENTLRAVSVPFEMAARGLGYEDFQQYMQVRHGCWWWPST